MDLTGSATLRRREVDIEAYAEWLQREGTPVFHAAGTQWRLYFGRVLIPASLQPRPVSLQPEDARRLFRESRASMIRWFSRNSDERTSYWYVLCDRYDFDSLPGKLRTQIRKARRECEVRALDADWMAANAYDCYAAAFGRYRHGRPISHEYFNSIQRSCAGAPFTFLGAFVDSKLAGFAKNFESAGYVASCSFRLDPAYKQSRPSYALIDALLRTYVTEQGKIFGNGFLSLHDDTSMQDFLLKFGFRRQYCDLQIAYDAPLGLAIRALYPFRSIVGALPSRGRITAVKSLLREECVRRSCQLSAETATAGRSLLSAN